MSNFWTILSLYLFRINIQLSVDTLFKKTIKTLGSDSKYLENYYNWYKENGNVSDYLKKVHGTPEFLNVMKGDL